MKMNWKYYYVCLRRPLARSPRAAFFFSHGLLHGALALVLCIVCWVLFRQTEAYAPEYRQIEIEIGTNHPARLDFFQLLCGRSPHVGPRTGRSDVLGVHAGFAGAEGTEERTVTIAVRACGGNLRSLGGARQGDAVESVDPLTESVVRCERIDSLAPDYVRVTTRPAGRADGEPVSGSLEVCGDLLNSESDNPYYHLYIRIASPSGWSERIRGRIEIALEDRDPQGVSRVPLHLVNVSPSTYTYDPLRGLSFEAEDVLKNGGIYLFAEDMNRKGRAERNVFFYSVMLGAALAFLLDVVVNLFVKWRNLARSVAPARFRRKGFRDGRRSGR